MKRLSLRLIRRAMLLCAVCLYSGSLSGADYDFVIRGGRVADGSGNPTFHADIAVKDARIVSIGRVHGSSVKEFDATGLIVAPGFIDVHTHAEDIDETPSGEN